MLSYKRNCSQNAGYFSLWYYKINQNGLQADTLRKRRSHYYYEASLSECRYLGCVLCNLMYRCTWIRAKASYEIIGNGNVHFVSKLLCYGCICRILLAEPCGDHAVWALRCCKADNHHDDRGDQTGNDTGIETK